MAEETGIMNKLRKRMKTIFWITAIIFVVYVVIQWGMNWLGRSQQQDTSKQVMGEVNGKEISTTLYQRALDQSRKNVIDRGDEYTDQTESQLMEQTWNEIVNRMLLEKQFQSKEVKLGENEIYEILKNNPPDVVKRHEAFQTNGTFDMQKFQQALLNPEVDWRPVENFLTSNVPYDKLKQLIESMVFLTNPEIKKEYIDRNEQVNVNFMKINPIEMENIEIDTTDEAIAKYYEENKDEFSEKPSVIMDYVTFPIQPSRSDSQEVQTKLNMIYQRLEDGEDFANLAMQFSQDRGTAQYGGELGYFPRGQMVPEFEEAAFSLDSGAVSEPFETSFGWHILKVLDKKVENDMEMVNAAHILITLTSSNLTVDSIRTMADSIYRVAQEVGLDSAAELTGLAEVNTTTPIYKKNNIEGIGFHTGLLDFAFSADEGDVYPVVAGDDAFYVYELVKRHNGGIPPLEDIKELVKDKMILAKKTEYAMGIMEKAYQALKGGADFHEVADSLGIEADSTGYFNRKDFVNNIGFDPVFKGTAFALNEDHPLSDIIEGDLNTLYIIEFINKKPADFSAYNQQRTAILQEIYRNRRTGAYNSWFRNLREEANITDNRYENLILQ
ncbi:peptidylprolyl isomerase [bacterium]|nr:peptidylprolyl isomerase [bacterium]